ncbi:MAG TPA: arginine deiminase-related protein [Candidatus Saccharimonadales bacterium]|nr:arginine deiminase-related protein [Candidatus Saccharimonadales bacterium]
MINTSVIMSGAAYFSDQYAINPYMDSSVAVQRDGATAELATIQADLESAGVTVTRVAEPENCQDGVYTANWGLVRGNTVVLSYLPNMRRAEQPHAEKILTDMGYETIKAPYRFSGQGDALPCGNYLFCGSVYRTDPLMHDFLAEQLGYEVIGLQTIPAVDQNNQPIINSVSGWPDSFFYDIDLALSVLSPSLIAWCPGAFTPESQEKIRALPLEKIEVSFTEATDGFACNLVSTGETVIMSARAPELKAAIEAKGLKTITPAITELAKGGGYIRCTTLTLDNQ